MLDRYTEQIYIYTFHDVKQKVFYMITIIIIREWKIDLFTRMYDLAWNYKKRSVCQT